MKVILHPETKVSLANVELFDEMNASILQAKNLRTFIDGHKESLKSERFIEAIDRLHELDSIIEECKEWVEKHRKESTIFYN